MSKKSTTIIDASTTALDGYGTPEEICNLLRIGSKLFWRLVNSGAFPILRLDSTTTGRGESRKVFVKMTDITAYLDRLHSATVAQA